MMASTVAKPRSSGIEGLRGPDAPPTQIKQQYGSVYELVLQLDEQRRNATTIAELLDERALAVRDLLVQHADQLIFQPHTLVGRKARAILWRKGHYDLIAKAKQLLAKQTRTARSGDCAATAAHRRQLGDIIDEGIRTYQSVIVRMNRYFKLDLQLLIDFQRLGTPTGGNADAAAAAAVGADTFPLELISYGLDSVHAALLSLGDLHRYRIDLQLEDDTLLADDRTLAAQFYGDAFKLNTKVGQAQNQLGTLFLGQSGDLDALYYYLYALQCEEPFQLAEHNVMKLFTANAAARASMDAAQSNGAAPPSGTIDTFMVRFVRLAQICFYDRPDGDGELQVLGHWALTDLRQLLGDGEREGRVCAAISGNQRQPGEFLFKVVATLLFGMRRLAEKRSPTLDILNALMVALCAELVKAANRGVERLLKARHAELELFADQYGQLYELFDRTVRTKRLVHRQAVAKGAKNGVTKSTAAVPSSSASVSSSSSQSTSTSAASMAKKNAGKTAAPVTAVKKPAKKQRNSRRRRRYSPDDDSDEEEDSTGSDSDSDNSDSDSKRAAAAQSDYEMDTDFGSTDDEEVLGGPPDVVFSDDDEAVGAAGSPSGSSLLEGEHFVYPNGTDAVPQSPIESMLKQYMRIGSPVAQHVAKETAKEVSPAASLKGGPAGVGDNLRFKRRYTKPDPNVIIEFAQNDCTLRALHVLFGWLQQQPHLLAGCYDSNPEFFDGIMRLLNHLNVDLFSNKVYFERSMVRTNGVRVDLERLFDMRATVPLSEDERLKDFALLRAVQLELDFEVPLRERLTEPEEHLVRMFKLVDFGFQLAKTRQYGMRFCVRTRSFVAGPGRAGGGGGGPSTAGGQQQQGLEAGAQVQLTRRQCRRRNRRLQWLQGGGTNLTTSTEENDGQVAAVVKSTTASLRKGYLKHRNQNGGPTKPKDVDTEFPALKAPTVGGNNNNNGRSASPPANKMALMGKLWLRSEVKALESEVGRRPAADCVPTPFLVVDAMALANFANLVKRLIKSHRFVVLVPSAALSGLDALKKSSDGARQAIRWLEREIGRGSRYMRMQRSYETQSIPLLKATEATAAAAAASLSSASVPQRRLDRDDYHFGQIAQFCNYMQASHADDRLDDSTDGSVVTLLTGVDLAMCHMVPTSATAAPLSYADVVQAIAPVHWEPIVAFYAKHMHK